MRAYCAAMAPKLGALMGSASQQELEINQIAMTPNDTAHSTNLHYILSLFVNNGREVWRRMVTRWEPKVPSRFRGMLQAILFPRWDIPGTDVTQLITAWENQKQDCEQQGGDIISDAIKLGVVLHHLPDASLREHLLLSLRSYDTYILMAATIGLSVLAKGAVCHV